MQLRSTAELKPLVEVTVHVLALLVPPWVTVRLDGLQETQKFGVGVAVTVSEMLADARQRAAGALGLEGGRPRGRAARRGDRSACC